MYLILPVKAVLPVTLTAKAELPVIINDPEIILDPVIWLMYCNKLTTDVLPTNEPVKEPVNEPDNNEGKLDENEPVNGPSPLLANEVECYINY